MSRETIAIAWRIHPLKVTSLQRVADLMSFYGSLSRPLDVAKMVFP
jgi:hypothetical protein